MKQVFPYGFIIDYLSHLDVTVKPMFGCHGIYIDDVIYLFACKRSGRKKLNGVSIAVKKEYAEEIKKEFPGARIGDNKNPWLSIAESSKYFEEYCIKFCELISKRDKRVGRHTKRKLRKIL
jgi:hypothetical protein